MKKFILLFTTAFISFLTYAQHNELKLELLKPLLLKNYSFGIQRSLGQSASAALTYETGFLKLGNQNGTKDAYNIKGWGITTDLRFYPGKSTAPLGWFVGPFFRYRSGVESYQEPIDVWVTQSNPLYENNYNSSTIGLLGGFEVDFGPRVTLDLVVGFGKENNKFDSNNGVGNKSFDFFREGAPFGALVGINIGYVFPKFRFEIPEITEAPNQVDSNATSGFATIVLYRPSNVFGFAVTYDVSFNGTNVYRSKNGTYKVMSVAAGQKILISAKTEGKTQFYFTPEEGKVYTLTCVLKEGAFIARPLLTFTDQANPVVNKAFQKTLDKNKTQ